MFGHILELCTSYVQQVFDYGTHCLLFHYSLMGVPVEYKLMKLIRYFHTKHIEVFLTSTKKYALSHCSWKMWSSVLCCPFSESWVQRDGFTLRNALTQTQWQMATCALVSGRGRSLAGSVVSGGMEWPHPEEATAAQQHGKQGNGKVFSLEQYLAPSSNSTNISCHYDHYCSHCHWFEMGGVGDEN